MARLIEDHDGGGRRYHLDDRHIECGTALKVYLQGGWLPIHFEIDGQRFPVFYLNLGNGDDQMSMRLPDTAELHWPPKEEHPEQTRVRKLRRAVEELAGILVSAGNYYDYERQSDVHRVWAVLQTTAPRAPMKD